MALSKAWEKEERSGYITLGGVKSESSSSGGLCPMVKFARPSTDMPEHGSEQPRGVDVMGCVCVCVCAK